jgi:hypothetical protein
MILWAPDSFTATLNSAGAATGLPFSNLGILSSSNDPSTASVYAHYLVANINLSQSLREAAANDAYELSVNTLTSDSNDGCHTALYLFGFICPMVLNEIIFQAFIFNVRYFRGDSRTHFMMFAFTRQSFLLYLRKGS